MKTCLVCLRLLDNALIFLVSSKKILLNAHTYGVGASLGTCLHKKKEKPGAEPYGSAPLFCPPLVSFPRFPLPQRCLRPHHLHPPCHLAPLAPLLVVTVSVLLCVVFTVLLLPPRLRPPSSCALFLPSSSSLLLFPLSSSSYLPPPPLLLVSSFLR